MWRITHLLQAEDGPWDLVVRLRRVAGDGLLGQLMDCFYCLSLWIAIPWACALGASWRERAWLWPALSGAAILLERMSARTPPPTDPQTKQNDQEHQKEKDDVLLRS